MINHVAHIIVEIGITLELTKGQIITGESDIKIILMDRINQMDKQEIQDLFFNSMCTVNHRCNVIPLDKEVK